MARRYGSRSLNWERGGPSSTTFRLPPPSSPTTTTRQWMCSAFEREAKRILKEVEDECGWMYETLHTDGKTKGRINYTVWSEVFACPTVGRDHLSSMQLLTDKGRSK